MKYRLSSWSASQAVRRIRALHTEPFATTQRPVPRSRPGTAAGPATLVRSWPQGPRVLDHGHPERRTEDPGSGNNAVFTLPAVPELALRRAGRPLLSELLDSPHPLMGKDLDLLTKYSKDSIHTAVELLTRVISAVEWVSRHSHENRPHGESRVISAEPGALGEAIFRLVRRLVSQGLQDAKLRVSHPAPICRTRLWGRYRVDCGQMTPGEIHGHNAAFE
jgi:hypothetical protein